MMDPRKIGQFLLGEWDKTRQPLNERMSVLPFGQYEDGSVGLAWPGMVAAPFEGMANFGKYGYGEDAVPYNAGMAADAAGGAMTGGLGLGLAGGLAENALGSAGGKLTRAAADLPMDLASRMARAKEMGFDTERTLYHGTKAGNLEAFDPSKSRTARYHFFTPEKETAAVYGDVGDYFIKSGNQANLIEPGQREIGALRQTFDAIGEDYGYQSFDEFLDDVVSGQMYQKHANQYFQNDVLGELNASGFDTVRMPDAGFGGAMSESTVVFDPRNIRSVNAAFDPSKSDSANLLAANAPTGAAVPLAMEGQEQDQTPALLDYLRAIGLY